MITVIIKCGFGNQLFMYCFGRILAEKFGMRMECKKGRINKSIRHELNQRLRIKLRRILAEKFNMHAKRDRWIYKQSVFEFGPKKMFNVETTIEGDVKTDKPTELGGQVVDFGKIDPTKPILVNGFFQRYEYYKPFKEKIKHEWLRIQNLELPEVDDETLCVNIRLGDYYRFKPPCNLTPAFYKKAIESTKYENVLIVTDEEDHPIITELKKEYNAKVFSGRTWQDDFKCIMAHKKIVLSDSTFSWWAAWLSQATEVISSGPKLDYELYGGMWARTQDMNLYVDDEPRYKFIV